MWVTEHHFLDEYSHLSANDVVAGYLAATHRAHPHRLAASSTRCPQVNHPAKVAERVAMLDHVSKGRFEFGTGRGAGSHEILGFLHTSASPTLNATQEIWEDVIGEFPKMWHPGHLRGLRGQVLVAAAAQDPAQAVRSSRTRRCGTPPATRRATRWPRARASACSASRSDRSDEVEQLRKSYKDGIANAEPIGAFVNDNIMVHRGRTSPRTATGVRVATSTSRPQLPACATSSATTTRSRTPDWMPKWPELIPEPDLDDGIDAPIGIGGIDRAATPTTRCSSASSGRTTGVDQLVFGIGPAPIEETLETIRLIGEHVIPKIDKDPEVSTTRYRRQAAG